MHNKLQQKWALKSHWELIDLDNNYYMAYLSIKEDKDCVLSKGPWLIGSCYLTVQPWKSNFNPLTNFINKLAVWVRMTNLSVEYMRENMLRKIGNTIGITFEVDRCPRGFVQV